MSDEQFTASSAVCTVCGLPRELCMCSAIARETQNIIVRATKRRYGRIMTVVSGIDAKDIKTIAKQLKAKLACGGTVKGSEIELQGDHRLKVRKLLPAFGFPAESISLIESIK